jgi:predicted kinase
LREPFLKFVESFLGRDVVLITCGLPATWKTETSEEVARIKGYPIVRTDLVRREVLKNEDIFDEKVASNMDKRMLVYDESFRKADETLENSDSVIIDATFITQSLRRRAAALAAKYNKTLIILHTQCPQEVSVARIKRRTRENYESNALTEEAYLNNKKKFEAIDMDDLRQHCPGLQVVQITVDTSKDPPEEWCIVGVHKR